MSSTKNKRRLPAVEGLFTLGDEPSLIGGRQVGTNSYCFPRHLGGADPRQSFAEVEEVHLSRRGRIWSFTNSAYPPPPPFITNEPYVPVVVAAVELELERIVVLGQVAGQWTVEELEVGMEVELVTGVLYEEDEIEYMTWQWRPIEADDGHG